MIITKTDGTQYDIATYKIVSNPKGHNKYTPKDELVPKKKHPYHSLTDFEAKEEMKRLFDESRFHKAMTLKYAQKVSFLAEIMGWRPKVSDAEKRAERVFNKKEGMRDVHKSHL